MRSLPLNNLQKLDKRYLIMKQYDDRKITFSKLNTGSIILRFFRNIFTTECPKCKKGRIKYIGDDWTGHIWINVYECNKCKTEFV